MKNLFIILFISLFISSCDSDPVGPENEGGITYGTYITGYSSNNSNINFWVDNDTQNSTCGTMRVDFYHECTNEFDFYDNDLREYVDVCVDPGDRVYTEVIFPNLCENSLGDTFGTITLVDYDLTWDD